MVQRLERRYKQHQPRSRMLPMGSLKRQLIRALQSLTLHLSLWIPSQPAKARCRSLALSPPRGQTKLVKNPHWPLHLSPTPFPGLGHRVWMLFRRWPAPVSPKSRSKARTVDLGVLSSMVPTMWTPKRYFLSHPQRDGLQTNPLHNMWTPPLERKKTRLGLIVTPQKLLQTVRMTTRRMSSSPTRTGAPNLAPREMANW